MMTPRQRQALEFIARFITKHGYGPSFDEIADAVEMKSRSGVHRLTDELRRRGLIERIFGHARCVSITDAGWSALRVTEVCPCYGRKMEARP